MEGAAYWLISHGFPCLLSHKTQDYQIRDGTTHIDWALPHQSEIRKMPYNHILWRPFHHCGTLLSNDSR